LETRSQKGRSTADTISVQCSQCKHEVSFHLDTTWEWSDGKGGEGAWLVLTEKNHGKKSDAINMDIDMA